MRPGATGKRHPFVFNLYVDMICEGRVCICIIKYTFILYRSRNGLRVLAKKKKNNRQCVRRLTGNFSFITAELESSPVVLAVCEQRSIGDLLPHQYRVLTTLHVDLNYSNTIYHHNV